MRTLGTLYGQASNNEFNDISRAEKMREEKFKRQLALIEKKGQLDIAQQEITNTGAKDVQGLKNAGELANTQLTGDIQESVRNSMVQENLSKVGLHEKIGDSYSSEARLKNLDADIKDRYGMDLGKLQIDQQGIMNKVTGEKAEAMGLENKGQRTKLEGLRDLNSLTPAEIAEINTKNLLKDGLTPSTPSESISINRTLAAIANPSGYAASSAIENIGTTVADLFKKKKITW